MVLSYRGNSRKHQTNNHAEHISYLYVQVTLLHSTTNFYIFGCSGFQNLSCPVLRSISFHLLKYPRLPRANAILLYSHSLGYYLGLLVGTCSFPDRLPSGTDLPIYTPATRPAPLHRPFFCWKPLLSWTALSFLSRPPFKSVPRTFQVIPKLLETNPTFCWVDSPHLSSPQLGHMETGSPAQAWNPDPLGPSTTRIQPIMVSSFFFSHQTSNVKLLNLSNMPLMAF
jgi:hypothetical protein